MTVPFGREVDRRAVDDGDIITPEFLRKLDVEWTERARCRAYAPPLALARPSRADATVRAAGREWFASHPVSGGSVQDGDQLLLHAFETAAVTRPPASSRALAIDAELCSLYLSLCHRWMALTTVSGDPRFLNAALKIAAVSILSGAASPASIRAALREGITALDRLAGMPPTHLDLRPYASWRAPSRPLDQPVRVGILAGASSRGLPLFRAGASTAGVPISGILLFTPRADEPFDSSYSQAWYPPSRATARPLEPTDDMASVSTERIAHGDWDTVVARLTAWRIDLVVLLGMDIVPPKVLGATTLGAINAHNGVLPTYRGMDAVGWTVLAGAEPTATVHAVTPDVDAGDVFLEQTVPVACADVKESMKATQIALLLDVCRTVVTTGSLPAARPQQGTARRYYRMHPAIKRLLDARAASLALTQDGVPS